MVQSVNQQFCVGCCNNLTCLPRESGCLVRSLSNYCIFSNNMTLPDNMDKENTVDARRLKTMSHALKASIKQAFKRKGLTCGMASCGELLHTYPASVMFCILPRTHNVSVHIHQMLIQAFCRENGIIIIELDEEAKLAALIRKQMERIRAGCVHGNPADTSCVMLQYPKLGCGNNDKKLIEFYEEMMAVSYPMPHLTLPD